MKRLQLRRPRAIRSTGIACCRPATPPHLSLRVPSLARDSPRHAVCRPERRLHHGTRMAEPGKSPRDDSTVPPMPQPGGIAARARAAAGAPYLNDLNPGAAAGGGDARRAGAGAGRRRNRQDPRADHAHRAHPGDRTGTAERNPRGHLHQQGRARDEAARRHHGRADRRGHAVARHLPFHRREDHPPPRRAGGPEARLHHPRRRRPDPSAQAAAGGGGHRREALARARAGRPDRQLEEPRPHARPGARRGGRELRRRQGQEALRRVSGAAEGAQRRRFRRPPARMHPAVPRAARGAAPVPGPLPLHPGGRVSGHERGAVSVAAPAGAEHGWGRTFRRHSGAR